jgi:hypothetical protein
MDRRTSIKWMLAAAAAAQLRASIAWTGEAGGPAAIGYGTDPDLVRSYRPGELWPLTFSDGQRRTAAALCALIIPADEHSPSAAQLQVQVFIDEWISAPYPKHATDREQILAGLAWLNEESRRRFGSPFIELPEARQRAVCDDICYVPKAAPEFVAAAAFFARFRDLTADGFYTTPEGTRDLGYVGNTPLATFEGPPLEALKKVGLA